MIIGAADEDRREIGPWMFTRQWENARMRASGVGDTITRMECRMRMYSRQWAHDRRGQASVHLSTKATWLLLARASNRPPLPPAPVAVAARGISLEARPMTRGSRCTRLRTRRSTVCADHFCAE